MLPDRVSNPGPLTYESGALPIALRGPAKNTEIEIKSSFCRWMELYTDTENCEAVNSALSPCIFFVLFCLLMS